MTEILKPTMMLVTSDWNDKPSFRLMPVTEDCPYVECLYDPESKVFVVISKVKKTSLHMLPKLDENGDPTVSKVPRRNGKLLKEERKSIETFQEYYVGSKIDIEVLIRLHAINAENFDYKTVLHAELEKKEASKK
jgi:hypothetical protein